MNRGVQGSVLAFLTLTACGLRGAPRQSRDAGVESCPRAELLPEGVTVLVEKAKAILEEGTHGEHHTITALDQSLPMFRKAALHGHVESMSTYAGFVKWYGFIDNDGTPFLGRSPLENAMEGLLFDLLSLHYGKPYSPEDAETYQVLLNPQEPYFDGFFDDDSGAGWMLMQWSPQQVDPIRRKAFDWKDCWRD